MRVTQHTLINNALNLRLAFISDLHSRPYDAILDGIRKEKLDIILVGVDVIHDGDHIAEGLSFLRAAAAIAPTFCSLGNHELKVADRVRDRMIATGAVLLDDDFVTFGGLVIGGLTSGFANTKQGRFKETPKPNMDWLPRFCDTEGVHILLSHHPEYYPRYLQGLPIELILSGHAHGGQWRFFGQGIFAPGQGFLPRFTAGAYRQNRKEKKDLTLSSDNSLLIVSRGLANNSIIPRLNNPLEWHILELTSDKSFADPHRNIR